MNSDERKTERKERTEASGTRFPVQWIRRSRPGRRMNGMAERFPLRD